MKFREEFMLEFVKRLLCEKNCFLFFCEKVVFFLLREKNGRHPSNATTPATPPGLFCVLAEPKKTHPSSTS
jgi:hypothetical protein